MGADLIRLRKDIAAGIAGLVGDLHDVSHGRSGLCGRSSDALDAGGDLARGDALFLDGGGDRGRDLAHSADDAANLVHRRDGVIGCCADTFDLRADLRGGLGCLGGKRLDLPRDHGETLAASPARAASIVAFSASRFV